ncbi:DUF397 domain-containing protein [Streptomyces katsurahamanus]|uniref:DUF397 domain-containing protein n=1 Tax=Streptomyces katsurahamanus TaxID=2577098 RepID=A0ABW9P0R9_9ACTN|nr:DUF397 domain-containing protein [Streptomyces katsurahamanus]MQS39162.1 DUF397 domain-containing protein [Streptomyces katsurahamanus]
MRSSRPDVSAATWRTSSYSNSDGGNCVEISDDYTGVVPVRDSKRRSGPVLMLSSTAFAGLVTLAKQAND